MGLNTLKGKLILAVASLVIGSGLLISLLASERQRANLLETMMAQGENIAQAIALETADKVLINDLVGLQKMLEHQLRSHNALAYLFIQRGEEILAHTFAGEIPTDLLKANAVTSDDQRRIQKIASQRETTTSILPGRYLKARRESSGWASLKNLFGPK